MPMCPKSRILGSKILAFAKNWEVGGWKRSFVNGLCYERDVDVFIDLPWEKSEEPRRLFMCCVCLCGGCRCHSSAAKVKKKRTHLRCRPNCHWHRNKSLPFICPFLTDRLTPIGWERSLYLKVLNEEKRQHLIGHILYVYDIYDYYKGNDPADQWTHFAILWYFLLGVDLRELRKRDGTEGVSLRVSCVKICQWNSGVTCWTWEFSDQTWHVEMRGHVPENSACPDRPAW